jgi:hypothetical protein
VILVVIPTFAALCDWQVHRALAGNELSWAYVFEWPFFGGYAIFMWWRFVHEVTPGGPPQAPDGPTQRTLASSGDSPSGTSVGCTDATSGQSPEEEADAAERAAYNRYLSDLATRGKRKQWR